MGLPYINIEDKTARDSWNTFISMLPDSIQQDFISDVSNKLESTEGRPLPFVKIHETAINRPYYEFPEDLFGTGWGTPDTIGVGANLKGNFSTLFENMMAELSHAFEEDIPLEDLKKQKIDMGGLATKFIEMGTGLDALPVWKIYMLGASAPELIALGNAMYEFADGMNYVAKVDLEGIAWNFVQLGVAFKQIDLGHSILHS